MAAGNINDIEKFFLEDSESIEIDEIFKNNLKKKIMAEDAVKKQESAKYIKIVASFIVAVVLSGTIIRFADNKIIANNTEKSSSPVQNPINELSSSYDVGELSEEHIPKLFRADNAENEVKDDVAKETKKTESKVSNAALLNTKSNTINEKEPDSSVKDDNSKNKQDEVIVASNEIKASKIEQIDKLPEEYKALSVIRDLGAIANNVSTVSETPDDSKDRVFEEGRKIFYYNSIDKTKQLIDDGKFPTWFSDKNLVSYVKEEVEVVDQVEKHYSTVWIYDMEKQKKYLLIKSDLADNIKDPSNGEIVKSQYNYLNSFWNKSGDELYVMVSNNETNKYEVLKLTLEVY